MGLEALEVDARRYRRPWFWLVVLFLAALLATVAEAVVAQSRIAQNVADFRSVQMLRLERAETSIDDFLNDAVQLVNAEAGAIGPLRGDRALVERLLLGMAPARNDRLMYGMGIFYAPGVFDRRSRLFGPYVVVLPRVRFLPNTETSDKEFHYPARLWYRDAVDAEGERVVDGPYTEERQSYISVLKAFYRNGALAGVASVDTKTSAFGNMVAAAMKKTSHDVVWITSRSGEREFSSGTMPPGRSHIDQAIALRVVHALLHLSTDASALAAQNKVIASGAIVTGVIVWILAATLGIVIVRGWRVREAALASELREVRLRHEMEAAKKLEASLRKAAYTDALTGLPNRTPFLQSVSTAMSEVRAGTRSYAVFFIDLDRFNMVNDTLGHIAGDELLKLVARRLRETLPPDAMVARLGGDEFVVLAPVDPSGIEPIARLLLESFKRPIVLESRSLRIGASFGIVDIGGEYSRPDELLRDADIAMFHAKLAGRGRYALFDLAMRLRVAEASELENDLRHGIEKHEFTPHYQPLCDIESASIRSFEALVRWQRPGRGLVPAAEFIGFAESHGLIDAIDLMVLEDVCEHAAAIRAAYAESSIAVNISAAHLAATDLVSTVAAALSTRGLSPSALKIEVTETAVMSNEELARATMTGLRDLGVQIVLDDFGQGHSSLAYLQHLPIAGLKIDRCFVEPLGTSAQALAIVRSIVALAGTLGLYTVAEGVENEAQLQVLRELGVNLGQGHLFAPPLALDELLKRSAQATAG
ncbi:MAG TPA: EAL domain-containing protein [Candidatus Baltobacteraceae bacterium]|jgi:diguanylate cyclase (GGDEF)-like protein